MDEPRSITMKHKDIRWNRINGEWFCAKCGRTAAHLEKDDALVELDQHECELPTKDTYGLSWRSAD